MLLLTLSSSSGVPSPGAFAERRIGALLNGMVSAGVYNLDVEINVVDERYLVMTEPMRMLGQRPSESLLYVPRCNCVEYCIAIDGWQVEDGCAWLRNLSTCVLS